MKERNRARVREAVRASPASSSPLLDHAALFEDNEGSVRFTTP